MSNPFLTCAGVSDRSPNLIHVYLQNDPMVVGYRFWGGASPNAAYGDPQFSNVGGAGAEALFTVSRDDCFRSPTIRRRGWGAVQETRRRTTHAFFSIEDYLVPGTALPPDDHWLFLRVQENRQGSGYLAFPGVPEATVTINGALAGDRLTIKGVVFAFQAGANDLVGKAGTGGDPFLVGLGAGDNAAAANLTLALNDAGDVGPAMDIIAPLNTHTLATNVAAPSAVVLVQPENAGAVLLLGDAAQFSVTSAVPARVVLDDQTVAEGRLVWSVDPANPVLGPIYLIPPALTYGLPNPSFTLSGTAPTTTCTAGQVPVISQNLGSAEPRPLHLVFSAPVTEITVSNLDPIKVLHISFGPGQLMQEIPAGADVQFFSGGVKELLLSTPDAGCPYSIHGILGLG